MADPAQAAADPLFASVPIEVTVVVGSARPRISELLAMGPETVLTLDRQVDDPVEVYIGDRLIARGMLEEQEGGEGGQLAVRLTEVFDPGAAR